MERLDKVLSNLGWFLKIAIYPLITPLFVVLNYMRLRDLVTWESPWAKMFLIVSVIYLLFTFGFAVYWIINNIKNPPS